MHSIALALLRALDATTSSVFITDLRARIVYVNRRFTEVTGWTAEEARGQNPRILQSGRTPASTYEAIWAALHRGDEWQGELLNKRKNGELYWATARISAVADASGVLTHYLGVEEDVTARKDLEAFSWSLAHDLKGPTTTMIGFAEALAEDFPQLGEEGLSTVDRIRRAGEQMAQLIDAMLRLSQVEREPLHRMVVDVSAVAEDIIAGLRETDAPREVKVHIEPNLAVRAEPTLVRMLLDNLLRNAWKYTRFRANATIDVGEDRRGIFVRDNGDGFEPGSRDLLFRPFTRLHDPGRFEGSGVGLYTVRRIVERHGGRVGAEGAPGAGATFWFNLGPDGHEAREEKAAAQT